MKICERIEERIKNVEKNSKRRAIEKEIPRVTWLKEDLNIMKLVCKKEECPQPTCVVMEKRHLN